MILLDIMLSRHSGLDLLRDICDYVASTPIVIITTNLPDSMRDLLTSFPAVKLIVPRPIDPKALATAVAELLASP